MFPLPPFHRMVWPLSVVANPSLAVKVVNTQNHLISIGGKLKPLKEKKKDKHEEDEVRPKASTELIVRLTRSSRRNKPRMPKHEKKWPQKHRKEGH